MDPIEAWVDVHDLRRMADALLSSSTLPPDPGEADDCLYGSDFVGYGPDSEPCSMNPGGETLLPEQGVENSARRALAAARCSAAPPVNRIMDYQPSHPHLYLRWFWYWNTKMRIKTDKKSIV